MNLYKMKDNLSVSSYPRTLYSIIISVGLLAVFITFASWILLSYPISTAVGNYVIGINGIVDVSSPASSQSAAPSEVNNVEKLKDRDGAEANQEEGNKGSAEGKPSGVNGNEKLKDRDGVDANREEGNKKNAEEKPSAVNDIEKLKDRDGADANREDKNKTSVEEITSEVRNDAKTTSENNWQNPTPSEVNTSGKTTAVINDGSLDANHEGEDAKKANMKPSSVSNTENTTQGFKISQDLHSVVDVGAVDVTKVKQIANDVKTDQPVPEDTKKKYTTENNPPPPLEGECDLFHGEWHYDESGPLYTNNSCPVITQMQNCQGNGRPDKGYENWRWKPSRCELPRFDPHKFLELMKGKTLAFVGDSVARNQMESLLCILWQAEVPKNRGNRHMQRWFFRSKSVMIVRIWSSWLVHQTGAAFKDVPEGVAKVFLDIPDETFMEHIPEFDVVVLSSGHWFAKQSIYIKNNEIVGTQLWSLPNGENFQVNNVEAFGISVDTAMTALATNPNYTGISILRSFSPDHYEGGAWNTGGSCTGKVEPAHPGHLVENGFTNTMHEKQVSGFNRATKKQTNRSKLRLMDITEVFSYRHDGHPGPYRSRDPNKITKRGPDGRPPPQDCLHWCMPGPVDTWNELVLEIIRREYER